MGYGPWGRKSVSHDLATKQQGLVNNDDCSHEIKQCFLPGRKAMTNLDSVLKSRDITLLTKVRIVKATLETRPDSPEEPGMQPRDPCLPWRGILGPGHTPR